MTEKQKKAFLKAERWKTDPVWPQRFFIDPRSVRANGDQTSWRLELAYAIASRRKRQREARRLKAAGWHWRCASRFHAAKAGYVHADYRGRYTRQEALQTLEARP